MTAPAAAPPGLLSAVGVDGSEELPAKASAFIQTVLAVGFSLAVQRTRTLTEWQPLLLAVIFGAALALRRWRADVATLLAAITASAMVVGEFPFTANHDYLLLLAALLALALALVRSAPDLQSLICLGKWIALATILAAGFQKLAHGAYDRGEMFAYFLAAESHPIARLLSAMVTPADLARLPGDVLDASDPRAVRLTSVRALLLSNVVSVAEMLLPLGVLIERLRRVALIGVVVFMALVAFASRELGFTAILASFLALHFGAARAVRVRDAVWVYTGMVLLLRLVEPNAFFK